MEYLSLPHTRASSYKLVPEVSDTLLTNLRNPIMTFVEDSTPGAHDTLTAACDANLYAALGVDKPAEHGSCAENLVLALKELNENAGLKGAKAVGADISVNIAPTPLHLFMVTPVELPPDAKPTESGAKGAKLAVEEPKGKKRSFVRFRAERDIVVVFSACPMDVGPQNGGRCMAANFMVEEAEANDAASIKSKSGKKTPPKKLNAVGKKDESKEATQKAEHNTGDMGGEAGQKSEKAKPKKLNAPNEKGGDKRAERKEAETDKPAEQPATSISQDNNAKAEEPEAKQTKEETSAPNQTEEKKSSPPKAEEKTDDKGSEKGSDAPSEEAAKPKKKPKKLQVRSKQ
jgi:uncharacterized protein YcgI (DUF1989 family)